MTFATFNIWFNEHFAEARYDAIADLLQPYQPDRIPGGCRRIITSISEQTWIQENYYVSDINGSTLDDYGVILLSRIAPTAVKCFIL